MDNTSPDDLEDINLPKLSSGNATSDMSHKSSDPEIQVEEVCTPEDPVNEAVIPDASVHQSGAQETGFESSAEHCQPGQEVKFSCNNEEQNINAVVPHGYSSENVQQENADAVISQESCNDISVSNVPKLCNNAIGNEVESHGCDQNQLVTELVEVPCATLVKLLKHDSLLDMSSNFVDSVGVVDGREKISEKSDLTTQMICDRIDEVCTSFINSERTSVDSESSVLNSTNDCVDQFNVNSNPCSLRCTTADESSCCASDTACYHDLFKTLAISIVDDILDLAVKKLLQGKNVIPIDANGSIVKYGITNDQVCDDSQQALQDSCSENIVGVSEDTLEVDVHQPSLANSSFDSIPCDIVSNVSQNANSVESTPALINFLQRNLEDSSESVAPVMCNGSVVTSRQSNFLNNSMTMPDLSGFEDVSRVTDCDSKVKNGDKDLEAIDNSSNGYLNKCEKINNHAGYPSEIDTVAINVGENIEDVKVGGDDVQNNPCKDLDCLSNHNSSLEAKVECSKVESADINGKSSTVSSEPCSERFSPVDCEEEKATSGITTSVLSIANSIEESKDLPLYIQDPYLEVPVNDMQSPVAVDKNVDDTNCLCANVEVTSKDVNTPGKLTPDCISVNDEIVSCSELSLAKIQDNTEEAAVVLPASTSFQENAELQAELCNVQEDLVTGTEKVNSSCDEGVNETTENENCTAGEQEIVIKEDTDIGTPISKDIDCIMGDPETVAKELIASADTADEVTFQVKSEDCQELVCVDEESKSDEVKLASPPLLESTKELNTMVPEIPQVERELIEAKTTALNSNEETDPASLSIPCQFIVPTVNICPPIMEETYDGITDDESERSHATSDSESDSNMKMVKPLCDGINTINYRPLQEEDSNDRSTLSLISELDEASVKEDNVDNEQLEDESVSLILDDDDVEDIILSSEVVQRVGGQRIKHEKVAMDLEENSYIEDRSAGEDVLNDEFAEKIKDIKDALKNDSLERLQELAKAPGGLVNDQIRKQVWPRLLGIDASTLSRPLPPISMEELRIHKEYNQVVLDVNRSLRRFPSQISVTERTNLQNQLTEIILRVLMKRGHLSYYQGYHDVAVTTLLVAGKDVAFHILERISIGHLADCMLPTLERTSYLLNYIYPLLQKKNPNLADRLDRLEIGTIFCLPWFLTWYSYSLNRYEDIVRVFDFFLASPPLAPLYLAAVVVGRRSAEVLEADMDYATVHSLLSRIPESLSLEDLLKDATDLYRDYPPEDIEQEVHDRYERLRKAQKEEEEQRRKIRQGRMQRRHSMPTMAAGQMPRWFLLNRFFGLPLIPGGRFIQATVVFGVSVLAWQYRNDLYRYW